jgi:dTDP-glucose 4,6-dehydratase
MEMKKVVITGGAGFVGVNLAIYLYKQGYEIVLIDRADQFSRLDRIRQIIQFETIFMDLSKEAIQLPENTDCIIHLAALPHVDYSYYHPENAISNNILSLTKILDTAVKRNVPVFFASSVEVYGGQSDKEYKETDVLKPVSPYGASKEACEAIIYSYQGCFNLKASIFRLTNLYGPFQLPDRIIPRAITRMMSGCELDVEGNYIRDFVHVENAARAIQMIMENECFNQIFNISSGIGSSILEIAEKLVSINGGSSDIEQVLSRGNKQRGKRLIINADKIKKELGWSPLISLEEGMELTYEWFNNNQSWWSQFESCYQSDRHSMNFVVDCVFS